MASIFQKKRRFKAKRTADSAGVVHLSKEEAKWFDALRTREELGEIACLELEPAFVINLADPFGREKRLCTVKADARFYDLTTQTTRVVDYKGLEGETPLSRLKRKMVAIQHGVEIEIEGSAVKAIKRAAAKKAWAKMAEARAAPSPKPSPHPSPASKRRGVKAPT